MAIFGSKKNKAPVKKPARHRKHELGSGVAGGEANKSSSNATPTRSFGVLKNPRITEKATFVSEHNVYTFDVSVDANESMVKKAVKETYGVSPLKVNLLNVRGKLRYSRGKEGRLAAGKKAYVFLKKGDKIEFA